ncbi:hypothetical protein [Streptomyces sp. NPDC088170]|uniref:hypothetical protein n=1 Tax=Streptomyces sp. NPDC088170 TaxID=3365834 RepID=UPI0037F3AAE2
MQLFVGGPHQSFPPAELAKTSNGVLIRLVCPHSARAKAATRTQLRQMVDSGARVRTTNHIFDNLVLVGDEVAFVAHQSSDENAVAPSVIAVYEPVIISLLLRLYEFAWQGGTDFDADAVSYGETLTDLNAGIIDPMAQGLKDEVVARCIGMGSRTFRVYCAAAGGGEAWLRDCAYGQGPSGTGNAAVWLRVGNVQHMSYVVRSLRA